MAVMTCDKLQAYLPDLFLGSARVPAHVPVDVQQHLMECSSCQNELQELQATMQLLDGWEAPEPSPYFDTRMAARLRDEKNSNAPGWLERIRIRLMFGSDFHLRPAVAVACALLLVVGAGSYEGFVNLNRTQAPGQTVSATVNDLELLDRNAQTLQEMAAFDSADATVGQSSNGDASN